MINKILIILNRTMNNINNCDIYLRINKSYNDN